MEKHIGDYIDRLLVGQPPRVVAGYFDLAGFGRGGKVRPKDLAEDELKL
jgi:hypothetical protein